MRAVCMFLSPGTQQRFAQKKRRRSRLFFGLGAIALVMAHPCAATGPADLLRTALRQRRVGEWGQARTTLEKVVKQHPKRRDARMMLMDTCVRLLATEVDNPYGTRIQARTVAWWSAALDQFEWRLADQTPIAEHEILTLQKVVSVRWSDGLIRRKSDSSRDQDAATRAVLKTQRKRLRGWALEWVRRKATFAEHSRRNERLVGIGVDLFLIPERSLGMSEKEIYAARLEFIDALAKANPWFTGWGGFLRPATDSSFDLHRTDAAETDYERYLQVLRKRRHRQLPMDVKRRYEHIIRLRDRDRARRKKRRENLGKLPPPRVSRRKPPPPYIELTRIKIVNTETGARLKPHRLIRCGDAGDVLYDRANVYLLATAGKARPILRRDGKHARTVVDVRWGGKHLWMAGRNGWVGAWEPTSGKLQIWDSRHGVEFRTDAASARSARLSLCPYRDRVFIICTQSPSPRVYKTWVGAVAPGDEKVRVFFHGGTVPDHSQRWQKHIRDITLGFTGRAVVVRTGEKLDQDRVIVERSTAWGRARPLMIDPATLRVTVAAEWDYSGKLVRQVGDLYVSHGSGCVSYMSAKTHREVHRISRLGDIPAGFHHGGALYLMGDHFHRLDDETKTATMLIKDTWRYSPRLWSMSPSKVYGIFAASRKDIFRVVIHSKPDVPWDSLLVLGDNKTLHAAALGGHVEAIAALLAAGHKINGRAKRGGGLGVTPLDPAAIHRISQRAKRGDRLGPTPLYIAAWWKQEQAVRLLLDRGADVHAGDGSWTPLHGAADSGAARTAAVLLEHGADPNRPDGRGKTPVLLAASSGKAATLAQLLKHGGDASVKSRDGHTLLQTAAKSGQPDAVEYLLKTGATLDVFTACVTGRAAALKEFLDKDNRLAHARDPQGWTLLHWLARGFWGRNDPAAMAGVLLPYKPEIDARNKDGETPLHLAAHWGKVELIRWLVANGATVDAADNRGRTPLARARQGMHGRLAVPVLEQLVASKAPTKKAAE